MFGFLLRDKRESVCMWNFHSGRVHVQDLFYTTANMTVSLAVTNEFALAVIVVLMICIIMLQNIFVQIN